MTSSVESRPAADRNQNGAPSDLSLFFRKFLETATAVGSPVPSSRALARAFVADIDPSRPQVVVELGAGTGAVTAELLRHLHHESRLLVVERDPEFCEHLQRKFPGVDIVRGDALQVEELLAERELPAADCILGEIPVHWLSPQDRFRFLSRVARSLTPGGSYHQLSFVPWLHRRFYTPYFESVQYRFVLRNLPPAGFYICRNEPTAARERL